MLKSTTEAMATHQVYHTKWVSCRLKWTLAEQVENCFEILQNTFIQSGHALLFVFVLDVEHSILNESLCTHKDKDNIVLDIH